jgi:hypothetical protein
MEGSSKWGTQRQCYSVRCKVIVEDDETLWAGSCVQIQQNAMNVMQAVCDAVVTMGFQDEVRNPPLTIVILRREIEPNGTQLAYHADCEPRGLQQNPGAAARARPECAGADAGGMVALIRLWASEAVGRRM